MAFWKAAAFAAAMTIASTAPAATITYSDASAMPYLQKFNPLLGTLTSVTFDNRYVRSLYLNYGGDPSVPTAPVLRITGLMGDAQFGQVAVDDLIQSGRQDPRTIGVTVSRTVNATFTGNLSYYTGTGLMPVAAFGSLTAPGYAPAVVSFPSPWSYVKVTYTFTPFAGSVPEPASWAMMMIGFGMVGAAARYRRRPAGVSRA